MPNSVVIAEPTRPATISAVSDGASSRTSEIATVPPIRLLALNSSNATAVWMAKTAPVKTPVSSTIPSEPTPTNSRICVISATRNGRRGVLLSAEIVNSVTAPSVSNGRSRRVHFTVGIIVCAIVMQVPRRQRRSALSIRQFSATG